MEFRILGALEAWAGESPVALGGPRRRAVLALLLLRANEVVPSERLIDELWSSPPETAGKVVQNAISSLRKALDAGRIETRGSAYVLRLDGDELDASRFERFVAAGRDALEHGDSETAASRFREADSLWRGPALAEFVYDDFARAHAFRLEELRLAAVEDRIEAELALGRHAELVAELTPLIAAQPLRERLRSQLMLALYRSGRQAEALAAYRDARRRLVDELGIEPSAQLQQLERAILTQSDELEIRLRPGAAAGGQVAPTMRKRVTVLVVTFRPHVREPGPLLARAADIGARVLERHEGSFEQLADGTLAGVFGLPAVHEDDALRAVRAASELREALARTDRDGALDARLGVESIEVVARPALPPVLTASDGVAAARTLADLGGHGEIHVGGAVARLVRSSVALEPAGETVFRLVDVPTGAVAIPRRLDAPLVGREPELRRLLDACERATREETCHFFTVLGPAGIGKTRLVAELAVAVGRDAQLVTGTCPPYGDAKTFAPIAEIVRQAIGDVSAAAIAQRLAGRPHAETVAQVVAGALGGGGGGAVSAEAFWAVRKLLEALAQERPLVVVLDDLHWAEATLLDLVENVGGLARGAILLVCLARPELLDRRPSFGGGNLNAVSVLLAPLDGASSASLVRDLLGPASLSQDAERAIAEAGAGNPLYLEQIVSNLIEEGTLQRERRRWIAVGDLSSRRLPPTIDALLTARLDRLEPVELQVLQASAVAGPEFSREAAADLVELPAERVDAPLESLLRKDLIRPAPALVATEEGFRFRHVLIRDAAYDSLPVEGRATLHERFADRLERVLAERIAEHEGLVGLHLALAHDYRVELGLNGSTVQIAERAAARLASAGRQAAAREDAPAAIALLRRAVALLGDDDPSALALLPLLGEQLTLAGEIAEAAELIDHALAAARASGNEALEWEARVARLRTRLYEQPPPTTDELRTETALAIEVLGRLGDERGLGRAWAMAAQAPWGEGRGAETSEAAQRSIEHATAAGDDVTRGRSIRSLLGALVFGPTPVTEASRRCREILADARGAPHTVATTTLALATLEAMSAKPAEAKELVERGRLLVHDLGTQLTTMIVAQVASVVSLHAGDAETAVREARAGYDTAKRLGAEGSLVELGVLLAQALHALGRDDEAAMFADEAAAIEGDTVDNVRWRTVKASILARQGDAAAAERVAREAVERAGATDFLALRGDALLALSRALAAAGSSGAAAAARAEAIALYEQKEDIAAAARASAE